MNYDLILTPAGHLLLRDVEGCDDPDAWMKRAVAAFSSSQAAGLFALATTKPDTPPSPSFSFWRDFACRYLTELCRTPESAGDRHDPIDPPVPAEMATTLLSAPPMQGGEYLNDAVLQEIWANLDSWVKNEISSSGDGLGGWLKKHAAIWHQVGRVCFHLAENKHNPELPFAFLATYAPRLSKGGRVQYQPLGKALQEYAGEKNKKVLINLLSPVHLASEKSDFVHDLVESSEVFHPLAWTPGEAFSQGCAFT